MAGKTNGNQKDVNFYKHHLGDYDGATAHLSWDEDLAYRRLLNVYYRLEAPIPKDPGATYRLVRAITKTQKEAVTNVLHEFFEERDDGWHNQRCDEEIAQFKADNEQNQERREGEKERQRRHRDRRKNLFAGLREHGVTPPWDATVDELVVALERVQQCGNNAPVTRDITATHKPLTTNHKPKKESAPALPAWVPEDAWNAWLEVRPKVKAPNTPRALALALRDLERLRDEGNDPRAVLEAAVVKGWRGLFPVKSDQPAKVHYDA